MAYRGKRTLCITLKKPRQPDVSNIVDIKPKKNFSLGKGLESVYPLLDIVFSYLGRDDLKSAAKVNKSWASIAERVLGRRTLISWIVASRKKSKTSVKYSSNYQYDDAEVGFVLASSRTVSMNDLYCCHDEFEVCPLETRTKFSDILDTRVVPADVKYCVISCDFTFPLFAKEHPMRTDVPLFFACFIPPIPNIHISMFYCDPSSTRDDYIDLASTKLRCMLLFCKRNLKHKIYDVLECLLPPEDCCTEVAIGGGIIPKTAVYPHCGTSAEDKTSKNNLCITFSEDRNCTESCFGAYSVVIPGESIQDDEFEAKVLTFKEQIVMRNNSVAFMICCAANLRSHREAKIFNKVFPDTLLMSLEAGGEMGWDNCFRPTTGCDNDFQEQKTKKSKRDYPIVQHQWSSVIVFITWGYLVNHTD